MNSHLDLKLHTIAERLSGNILYDTAGKVSDPDAVMAAQKSIVNVFLYDFESSTCHVCLSDSLDLLKTILLAKRIKGIIDAVQKFNKISAIVLLGKPIEALDVNENDCNFALRL